MPKQVFILTQERFQVLLAVSDIVFDLIVADEAQNMSDGSRGMILQECLEQALERNGDTRLVMLAPGADGFKEVGTAIGRQEMQIAASSMPSVIQNRIVVAKSAVPNTLELSLLTETGTQSLGRLTGNRVSTCLPPVSPRWCSNWASRWFPCLFDRAEGLGDGRHAYRARVQGR